MKSISYILIIIGIAPTQFAKAQSKVGHFDQHLILKKMAEKRRPLASWKTSWLGKYNNASDAPAIVAAADSAKADSILLKVIKDWNYQYVFNPDYLLAAPVNSNLMPLVAKKMCIKMPDSNACDVVITTRFAYCNRDSVVAQLSEKKVVDSLLTIFQNDSLPREYDSLLATFIRYDSCLKTHYCPPSLFSPKDMTSCFEKLQNWV